MVQPSPGSITLEGTVRSAATVATVKTDLCTTCFLTYKLKSNNTLKNSEKKQLAQRILDNFSTTTEEKVKELVPIKSNASCMRLITHSGDTIAVYVVDGEPIILETADRLCPTLCGLWKLPDLLPTITIHSLVLGKIQGGAPLYLPGVTIPVQGRGFPIFSRGATIAINTESNSAPAVVGTALMSSGDMLLHGNGVCLDIIHVLGDFLCKDIKFNKITRPAWGPASYLASDEPHLPNISSLNIRHQAQSKEEWPALGSEKHKKPPENEVPIIVPDIETEKEELPCDDLPPQTETQDLIIPEELEKLLDEKEDEDRIPEDMDGLLRWCLLSFLKQDGRKLSLPLKTNLLYKNHLMPLCPPSRVLDVKKSTYKKMSKFLDAMQKEGLIETREIEKGVSALVSVNLIHPAVRAHTASAEAGADSRAATAEVEKDYTPPVVRELFSVTAPTAPVLPPHKKGTALTGAEARSALTAYVRTRGLQDPADPRRLRLDQPLATLLKMPAQVELSRYLWLSRHHDLNDIRRALISDNVSCTLELPDLSRSDNKRPNGTALIPWQRGRCLIWDATCVNTFAASYLNNTSRAVASGVESAAKQKHLKDIPFFPVDCETTGPWGN
ncbi:Eukaryotic translation initiation factor 2D [Eumeta japonica]|uniref:Eukaryotic translation initiation factor 2D n=1 Tax=Eumeta variegata TaxID=151549 RepID=A0A4C1ZU97_EUMVA|nr:Eukaryotic translation initiation factor 2D [Eumeta japonica]